MDIKVRVLEITETMAMLETMETQVIMVQLEWFQDSEI